MLIIIMKKREKKKKGGGGGGVGGVVFALCSCGCFVGVRLCAWSYCAHGCLDLAPVCSCLQPCIVVLCVGCAALVGAVRACLQSCIVMLCAGCITCVHIVWGCATVSCPTCMLRRRWAPGRSQ